MRGFPPAAPHHAQHSGAGGLSPPPCPQLSRGAVPGGHRPGCETPALAALGPGEGLGYSGRAGGGQAARGSWLRSWPESALPATGSQTDAAL